MRIPGELLLLLVTVGASLMWLFEPFANVPMLALLPAATLFSLSRLARARRRLSGGRARVNFTLIAALSWAAYIPYEYATDAWCRAQHGCIRIDLALAAVVLLGLSLIALCRAIWARADDSDAAQVSGRE